MSSQPGGDNEWDDVLAHRPADQRDSVRLRFESAAVEPGHVAAVLRDGGDALFVAAGSGAADWATAFGGRFPAALLAAEVGALTAHLTSRASAVRALAVGALLDDFSAVTVAARLGVSRQKVYDIARSNPASTYIDTAPWRRS